MLTLKVSFIDSDSKGTACHEVTLVFRSTNENFKMTNLLKSALLIILVCQGFRTASISAQDLSQANIIQSNISANDVVYDSSRDVLYASVGSDSAIGNSILTLNPNDLSVIDRVLIGSEPGQLAISSDNSHVFVGIDGARAVRTFQPGNGRVGPTVGPLHALFSQFNDPAVAEDIVASPFASNQFVVSIDEVGSSADGVLGVFDSEDGRIGGATGFFNDANSLTFIDPTTLVTFNNSSSGFDLTRWEFDGTDLTFDSEVGGLVRGFSTEIEAGLDGAVFGTDGTVADATTLTGLGTLNASGALEVSLLNNTTFFFGNRELQLFDNESFLQIDSVDFDDSVDSGINDLIFAGNNRLAYVSSNGSIGVISNVPFSAVPEPSSALVAAMFFGGWTVRRRRGK